MEKYNVQHKIQMIKWFYAGNSIRQIQQLCNATFKITPAQETVRRIVKNFERHGCVAPLWKHRGKRPVDPVALEREMEICKSIETNPFQSSRTIADQFGLSSNTICHILKKYGYKSYKIEKENVEAPVNSSSETE